MAIAHFLLIDDNTKGCGTSLWHRRWNWRRIFKCGAASRRPGLSHIPRSWIHCHTLHCTLSHTITHCHTLHCTLSHIITHCHTLHCSCCPTLAHCSANQRHKANALSSSSGPSAWQAMDRQLYRRRPNIVCVTVCPA